MWRMNEYHVTRMNESRFTHTGACTSKSQNAVGRRHIWEKDGLYRHPWRVRYYRLYTDDLLYGVASISRLLKIIGLFCKRALRKRPIFSKETYNFKEPANRSHPIPHLCITTGYTRIKWIMSHIPWNDMGHIAHTPTHVRMHHGSYL